MEMKKEDPEARLEKEGENSYLVSTFDFTPTQTRTEDMASLGFTRRRIDISRAIFTLFFVNAMEVGIKLFRPDITDQGHRPQDLESRGRHFRDVYDFIVVGAGSSGAVIANRLSEELGWSVLLLEAGGDETRISDVPVMMATLQRGPLDWNYVTEYQEGFCQAMENGRCLWPRGKLLGGTSAINGMIYVRGNRRDYDNWASMGNPEWSYDQVLPYFKKSEDMRIEKYKNSPYHGVGGYLSVEEYRYYTPLLGYLLQAVQEVGHKLLDFNGETQSGFNFAYGTLRGGVRCSTAKAFLRPARDRLNLDISLHSLVERVVIDPQTKVVQGVVFSKKGRTYNIGVKKEVILSAGALNSPQILMLSGVGPADHLREVGISPVISDLHVGHNLQDHIALGGIVYTVDKPLGNTLPRISEVSVLTDMLLNNKGPMMAMGVAQALGFASSSLCNSSDYPDIGYYLSAVTDNIDGGVFLKNIVGYTDEFYNKVYEPILYQDSYLSFGTLLRPKSRGYVKLRDKSPHSPPLIYPNFLSHRDDIKILVEAGRLSQHLSNTPTMRSIGAKLNPNKFPGCEHYKMMSDEYLECALRKYTMTLWHPSGTCKMGPDSDPYAVLDPRLRVRGVQGLRVADASIMPDIVSGNLNVPCIMIGEKVSDMINHLTQTSSWLPPAETWVQSSSGFPYGWEQATDQDGKYYFINDVTARVTTDIPEDLRLFDFTKAPFAMAITKFIAGGGRTSNVMFTRLVSLDAAGKLWQTNKRRPDSHSTNHNFTFMRHFFLHKPSHLNKTTTYEDPRKDWTEEPPQPREVELTRHPELGFGFVAGSEKPVIVRFVTEGGPSVDKLQPGDQILVINGEDVKKAPRDHVIQLVRACKDTVRLLVCQPPLDNSARKSALLSAAKKAKLKSNPSRVRFAEGVVVNGSPLFPPSTFSLGDSSVPFMPNVLKVFLENGQTKSFKYDSTTLVQDVVGSLQQKLCIKSMEHFSLVVEHVKSLRRNKITLLDPQEPLARCCNDVVQERYAPELKYDIALRLAALHIHQHAVSNNMTGKITVKAIENEFGLERFVPVSLMTSMKRKELRKLISHFLKLNHNLSPSGQKSLTSLQAKLYYLNIIGELPSYGAKCFSTNIRDSNMERVILVSPRFGISQITGLRNSVPVPLADIEHMNLVKVTREDELSRIVRIHFAPKEMKILVLNMEDRDAEEFVLVLQGYFRLLTGEELPVQQERDILWVDDSVFQRITTDLKLRLYRLLLVTALNEDDPDRRAVFAEAWLAKLEENPELACHII
uniref:Glucose dehydrogenase n=1 Tax=Timema shepardi TaxID=629360 RepID=A0A7R9AMI1_TIMSH|nr:unnamed protein product [Timema shepardi]